MEENNKIIAEFMGAKYDKDTTFPIYKNDLWLPIHGICNYTTTESGNGKILCYHKDWNWLMEVVEKILNICSENDDLEKWAVITDNVPYIQPTYNECVKFINFYNKQKEE